MYMRRVLIMRPLTCSGGEEGSEEGGEEGGEEEGKDLPGC